MYMKNVNHQYTSTELAFYVVLYIGKVWFNWLLINHFQQVKIKFWFIAQCPLQYLFKGSGGKTRSANLLRLRNFTYHSEYDILYFLEFRSQKFILL